MHLLRKARTLVFVVIPRVITAKCIYLYSYLIGPVYTYVYKAKLHQKILCQHTRSQAIETIQPIHFVTLARTEFYDLLPIYQDLLSRYLPHCFSHTYVSNRRHPLLPEALVFRQPFKWNILNLLANHVTTKYICLLHLDYFLLAPVQHQTIINHCQLMDHDNRIDFIQLAINCGEKRSLPYSKHFDWLDEASPLFFNMQVRLWRVTSLMKLMLATKYCRLEHETMYSLTLKDLGQRGLIHNNFSQSDDSSINNAIYPYMATALNARKWRKSFETTLLPLLTSFNVDPSIRGWTT